MKIFIALVHVLQALAVAAFGYSFFILNGLLAYWPLSLDPQSCLYPAAAVAIFTALLNVLRAIKSSRLILLFQLSVFVTLLTCTSLYYQYSEHFVKAYFEIAEGETMQGNFLGMQKGAKADISDISSVVIKAGELHYEYEKDMEKRIGRLEVELDRSDQDPEILFIDERGITERGAVFHLTGNYGYAAELEIANLANDNDSSALASGDLSENTKPFSGGVFFPPFLKSPNDIETNFNLPGSDISYLIDLVLGEQIIRANEPWKFKIPNNPELKISYVDKGGFKVKTVVLGGSAELGSYDVKFASLKTWAGVEVIKDPYRSEANTFFWLFLVIYGSYLSYVVVMRVRSYFRKF